MARYLELAPSCKFCGNPLPYEGRSKSFCGRSCAAKYNNRARGGTLSKGTCVTCGCKVAKSRTYCPKCFESSKLLSFEEVRTDRGRRRALLRERGHSCEICKNSEWCTQPIPIELDHMDGNSDNNDRSNLRLVCPNCHAQTSNYKGRNRGRGVRQIKRRERFASGKTF
jgi:hypothetical protein